MTASAAGRAGVAVGWWLLVVARSQDRASCSQTGVDTASWGFDLHVEVAEDQGLRAGTEHPIPRVEVELGVGIDSEAVRSGRSPGGIAGAEGDAAALAASAAVDRRALSRQHRQGSPPSQ